MINNSRLCGVPISVLLFIILFIALVSSAYFSPVHRWGDASTYYMMVDSITNDHDIKYEREDIQRAFAKQFDDLPAGLFLVKDKNSNFYYAKEYTYSLIASPFYWLMGNNGILVFNSILLFIMILMGYFYLKLNNSNILSFFVSVCYFMFSTAFIYMFWIHADLYIMFLIMLAFFLCSIYVHSVNSGHSNKYSIFLLYFSAIVFGVATFSKMPNFIGILPLIAHEVYFKRYKQAIFTLLVFLITTLMFYGSYYLISGNITPYNYQFWYIGTYPFWNNCNSDCGYGQYVTDNLIKLSLFSVSGFQYICTNFFYYIFGRFTGVVWYYPFILVGLLFYFKDTYKNYLRITSSIMIWRSLILAAILLNIFLYIYLDYDSIINYFGGQQAIGNRYFYIYPAFLFLINKVSFNKNTKIVFIIVLIMSAIFVAPLNLSPIENSLSPMEHTVHLPYVLLPLEYTELDDLPLLNPSPVRASEDTYYFPISNIERIDDNYVLIGSHTEILIKSNTNRKYNISLMSIYADKNITLLYNGLNKNIELKKLQMVTIDLFAKPVSKGNGWSVYDFLLYDNSKASGNEGIVFTFTDWAKFTPNNISYIYGWYDFEKWGAIPTRWMKSDAIFLVNSPRNCSVILNLCATSFYRSRMLEINVSNEPKMWIEVPTNFVNISLPISLSQGENVVRLNVPEGCERPCDKPELNNPDSRCLSIAVQNLTVV